MGWSWLSWCCCIRWFLYLQCKSKILKVTLFGLQIWMILARRGVRYHQVEKFTECLVVFCFKAKRFMRIIKKRTIMEYGIPQRHWFFLKILKMCSLLKKSNFWMISHHVWRLSDAGAALKQFFNFFSSRKFPDSFHDLNVCDNNGNIWKDFVEEQTMNYDDNYNKDPQNRRHKWAGKFSSIYS